MFFTDRFLFLTKKEEEGKKERKILWVLPKRGGLLIFFQQLIVPKIGNFLLIYYGKTSTGKKRFLSGIAQIT